MDDVERRGRRLRSFVIGGVVGASAAIAALRRDKRRRRREGTSGLGAFESAPCYLESAEKGRREST
jgi:hypothetical protein